MSIVGAAKRLALDAAFPERCFSCGANVYNAGALCVDCWPEFTLFGLPMCALCAYPFPHAVSPCAICAACTKWRPAFDAARAALLYDDASREIILRFKHADRTRYANAFGAWIIRAGAELVPLVDVVVPVPLYPRRLIGRLYNHSLLLARAVARLGRLLVIPDAFRRNRNTPSQGNLSRGARYWNVQGAFSLRGPAETGGKSILLIDYVYITGASVEACTHFLKKGCATRDYV
ncbi:MAG: double zinc ribbon domain-containing protein, partial [Pseudomonadota bacterium]|nr:double zinc ribbon domain-containing protein [Pseudomonadota bacterium]